MVECVIDSRSSEKSVFDVTWSRKQRNELPLTIFTVNRDGTLEGAIPGKTLIYNRPSTSHYTLTVHNVDHSDNGQYQCQVVEWLEIATNTWRKVAEDKSGELLINVEDKSELSVDTFTLETAVTHQNATEGEDLDISYSINLSKMDSTSSYTLSWYVAKKGSSTNSLLLSHSYDGQLQYHLKDQHLTSRLQFYRPTAKTFHLTIRNLDPSDSGNYQCRVEQHQLDCKGNWKKIGSPQMVSTMVNVYKIGKELLSFFLL